MQRPKARESDKGAGSPRVSLHSFRRKSPGARHAEWGDRSSCRQGAIPPLATRVTRSGSPDGDFADARKALRSLARISPFAGWVSEAVNVPARGNSRGGRTVERERSRSTTRPRSRSEADGLTVKREQSVRSMRRARVTTRSVRERPSRGSAPSSPKEERPLDSGALDRRVEPELRKEPPTARRSSNSERPRPRKGSAEQFASEVPEPTPPGAIAPRTRAPAKHRSARREDREFAGSVQSS